MPHKVVKRGKGKKPYKIVNKNTGKVKGASSTRKKAKTSARIRDEKSGHGKKGRK